MKELVTQEPLAQFLISSQLIDTDDPLIVDFVDKQLVGKSPIEMARTVFHFVRDEISHSRDIQSQRVTRSANDVITYREGICYAKSHLFAALLRRAGVPTGICYQRLTLFDDASGGYAIHALNTVYLEPLNRWIRLDARGNKPGVNAQFSLDEEILAFPVRPEYDEVDYLLNFAEPHPLIVQTLVESEDAMEMYLHKLPEHLEA
jgi:transglutaminase-like putative cysteine protease